MSKKEDKILKRFAKLFLIDEWKGNLLWHIQYIKEINLREINFRLGLFLQIRILTIFACIYFRRCQIFINVFFVKKGKTISKLPKL